ncbi:MAG: primosomal protein N' [Planctomycetota bacterium]|nr:primosomal protein N' [Planctomycetota bacterium]
MARRRESPAPDLFSSLEPPAPAAQPARQEPLPADLRLAEVAVESGARGTFTYRMDAALAAQLVPGARVRVPFGPREVYGYYLGPRSASDFAREGFDLARLKFIRARVDAVDARETAPLLTPELLELARWIARRYACTPGGVLAAMLPAGVKRFARARRETFVRVKALPEPDSEDARKLAKRAPKQAALLNALRGLEGPLAASALLSKVHGTRASLNALAARDWVELIEADPESLGAAFTGGEADAPAPLELTAPQQAALAAVEGGLSARAHKVYLLEGVTGSGKTEVYLRALQAARRQGRQGIVLVPEIALTPQTAHRFESRLGRARVAVLHSHLTEGERAEAWRAARAGEIDAVVGARSALFAPLPNLGCIVVDEEHEGSFKQDSAPRYHAREAAVERGRLAGAVVILGSATPSLESVHAAAQGRYARLVLPGRVLGYALPGVRVVDMRRENAETKRFNYLSRALSEALRETFERREQSILFLNRRGFATVVTCARCGYTETCARCDVTLIEHKKKRALQCHYCGFERPVPTNCRDCGAPNPKFWGLGTERVEEEVRRIFPAARLARMDSDTMNRREAYVKTLGAFRAGQLDVLVGTQMIAKGLDFPNVTLVGIVLADTALHMPDFRSRERTFQLIEQVAGRAGRGAKGGRVIVQTHLPQDPAIRHAAEHDFEGFCAEELPVRRTFGYPPYTVLARVLVRGKDKDRAREAAREAADALKAEAAPRGVQVLGPSAAPLAMLDRLHRFHLMLKAPGAEALAEIFAGPARVALDKLKGAEAQVDVDPLSML